MAKSIIGILYFLCIGSVIGVLGNDAERVAKVYTAEIGVKELTGKNDGHRVEQYLATCGLPKGHAWCAAFVTWTFQQAGVKAVVSAWSPAWFPQKNTIYTRGARDNLTPDMADVFGIWFQNLGRIAHVGFIHEWEDGKFCITVEGNTNDAGSRDGDGVYMKRRLQSQIYKVSRWLYENKSLSQAHYSRKIHRRTGRRQLLYHC